MAAFSAKNTYIPNVQSVARALASQGRLRGYMLPVKARLTAGWSLTSMSGQRLMQLWQQLPNNSWACKIDTVAEVLSLPHDKDEESTG